MCSPVHVLQSRDHARNLLIPGIREAGARRGLDFSNEETEAVVDAYISGFAADGHGEGVRCAIALVRQFQRLPAINRSRQAHLSKLRSVSPAYRRSAIPSHFRERTDHASRQSPQEDHGNPDAPPDSGNAGAHHPGAGYYPLRSGSGANWGGYVTSTFPTLYLANSALAHQIANTPPGGIIPLGLGQTTQQWMASPAALQAMAMQNVNTGQMRAEPPEPLPQEIKPGEITAWRAWRVEGKPGAVEGLCLRSMSMGTEWTPRIPMRGNIAKGDGVHAWKTKDQAIGYAGYSYTVFGEVELWGQVIEHEDGYRAEYGAIKSLHRSVRTPIAERQLRALRVLYGLEAGKPPRPSMWTPTREVGAVAIAAFLVAATASMFAVTSSTVLVVMSAFAGILMLFAMLTAD